MMASIWMCVGAESARLGRHGIRPPAKSTLVPPPDRRQSETALAIARGTARLLRSLGFACVSELPLPSGRRADLVALNERGEIWIVEIKSSVEDLRADQKWQDYRAHCDRLFFAFTPDLPCEIFPADTGLIVADAYGAHLHCEAPEHRLPAPTRKSMMLRFAMARRNGSTAGRSAGPRRDCQSRSSFPSCPGIHDLTTSEQADGRDKPGRDEDRVTIRLTAARASPESAAGCGDAC